VTFWEKPSQPQEIASIASGRAILSGIGTWTPNEARADGHAHHTSCLDLELGRTLNDPTGSRYYDTLSIHPQADT